ncbi:MAG: hypothetical protein ACLQVJ_29685 [Syntrophobacteraceae bacterium]
MEKKIDSRVRKRLERLFTKKYSRQIGKKNIPKLVQFYLTLDDEKEKV